MLFALSLLLIVLSMLSSVRTAPVATEIEPRGSTVYSGDGTFYDPGLGACGKTNSGSQFIVAVGHGIFDSYPGATLNNPNKNPICGKKLKATSGTKSVTLTVVDRCPGCAGASLDMSEAGFKALAPLAQGRIHNLKWQWV